MQYENNNNNNNTNDVVITTNNSTSSIVSKEVATFGTDSERLEEEHVHQVYNTIAPHFSETRYKPWPTVDKFLKELPPGTSVADVGCGNGKYLGINKRLAMFGCDRSEALVEICLKRGYDCIVCDNLRLPYRSKAFDHAISIAVIHHFSNRERRLRAIQELRRITKQGGKILISVWAFEKQTEKKRYAEQDVFVPWHLRTMFTSKKHHYQQQQPQQQQQQPQPQPQQQQQQQPNKDEHVVYKRYYHLFKQGELDELIREAGGLEVEQSFFEKDNWVLFARVL